MPEDRAPVPSTAPPRRTTFGWAIVRASDGGLGSNSTGPRSALLRIAVLVAAVFVIAALATTGERYARATALLLALAGTEAPWAPLVTRELSVETVEIAGEVSGAGGMTVRARVYRPVGGLDRPRGMVLAHGVHWLGIDEPRLTGLARAFARAGVTVVTPELAPLADYRVDAEGNLDALRASVRWLARDRGVKGGGVGLIGVSFAGGLALRVAAEPAVADDLAFVTSIGGHHDMPRVARFFVTDRVATPEGDVDWRAHDYGLAVLVYNAPERFVPAEDAARLRIAVRAFLRESYRQAELESLSLSPSARAVFDRILHRDRMALAATVLRELPSMAPTMQAASPAGRLASVRVPVFLLHGAHDDVVPPSESRFSAAEATGSRDVHLLVSRKIGHAELGKDESRLDELRLVHFMAELLGS